MKNQTCPTIQEAYSLNESELKVLQSLVNQVVECTGNEFGYMEDASRIGMGLHSFAGYISQLKQKGCFDYLSTEFGGQYALKEEIITEMKKSHEPILIPTEKLKLEEVCSPQDIADAKKQFPDHTQGEWRVVERDNPENSHIPFGIEVPVKPSAVIPVANICAFPPNNEYHLRYMEANARRIVKCVNMHDELIEALKTAKKIIHDSITGEFGLMESEYKDGYSYIESLIKDAERK